MDKTNHVTIIAEAGVNHNGDMELAKKLIDAAADAGADYVKFQSFQADKLVNKTAEKADYQKASTDPVETQWEMLKRLELSDDDHDLLIAHCEKRGIKFLSTPFDQLSIALLRSKGIHIGKIPSGELTNKPFIALMAIAFEKIIISTGMCTLEEVMAATHVLMEAGAKKENITVLHCNTEYPTPMQDVNLRAMESLRYACKTEVGYSDHTLGIEIPIAATALGATIIEKHFTLDRTMPGPDHKASLEPAELKAMVIAIRNVELAMSGSGVKEPSPSEMKNMVIARKSIHLASDIPKGQIIERSDLVMLRPGDGISPMDVDSVVGKKTTQQLKANDKLVWEHLES